MAGKGYQGWTNYETWVINLWINNDRSSVGYWREAAQSHKASAPQAQQVKDGIWSVEEAAKFNLAAQLKAEFNEGNPIADGGVHADLLNAALEEVNWNEVAEHLLED